MKINLSSFLQWRFNTYIFKNLGWRFTFFYLNILGKLYFFFNIKESWKIKKAVNAVFEDRKTRSEIKSIRRSVFRGILSHYYEKLFNAYCNAETLRIFVETHIESESMEAIKQGLSRGKGVLLITGHCGGVELIPAFLGANNYQVTIVAKFKTEDLRNKSIRQAKKFSAKIIDADNTPNIMKAVFDHLKENRIVITQCDEIEEWKPGRNDSISFLGKPVLLDRTIDIITRRCRAAVVFGVMHREYNHRYKFIATSQEEMAEKSQRYQDISIGALVLKFMEHYIYKYPEGWYQWKKYPVLDMFAPAGTRLEAQPAFPLLEPFLGKV
jgi:KDO2-lipid IV(A) lauroyltransferase